MVIELLARRCLPLGHPSAASGACAVANTSSKRQCGERQVSLKAALLYFISYIPHLYLVLRKTLSVYLILYAVDVGKIESNQANLWDKDAIAMGNVFAAFVWCSVVYGIVLNAIEDYGYRPTLGKFGSFYY